MVIRLGDKKVCNCNKAVQKLVYILLIISVSFFIFTLEKVYIENCPKALKGELEYRWEPSFMCSEFFKKGSMTDFKWETAQHAPLFSNKNGVLWIKVKLNKIDSKEPCIFLSRVIGDSFEVFIGDKLIFSDDKFKHIEGDNEILDTLIPLPLEYENTELYIKIHSSVNSYVGIHGDAYLDSYGNITKHKFNRYVFGISIGLFFIVLSLVMFIASIYYSKELRIPIITLGIAAFSAGVWNITGPDGLLSVVDENAGVLYYLYNLSMLVTPAALAYFFKMVLGKRYEKITKWISRVLTFYCVLYMVVYTLNIPFEGIFRIIINYGNRTLPVVLSFEIIVLNIIAIIYVFNKNTSFKIFAAGSVVLGITAILNMINVFCFRDSSLFFSLGIAVFIISLFLIAARNFAINYKKLEEYSIELKCKNAQLEIAKDELAISRDKMAKWSQELEKNVKERTIELEHKNKELEDTIEDLHRTREQLIESEKMVSLGRMIAGVAHEINTPVGIGITAISYLDEKTKNIKESYKNNSLKKSHFEEYMDACAETSTIINSNLKRAAELIKSFKQMAADQYSYEIRNFNVREYIDWIILNLKPHLKKTKHVVCVKCEDNLVITNYPGAFSQIITNLVMNSLMHGYNEEDSGKIIIDIKTDKDRLILKYSDDGNGIPNEILEKIYEPFFTSKRGTGGTGLGMNIVYNIVTQTLRGSIQCNSKIGEGTEFILNIPI